MNWSAFLTQWQDAAKQEGFHVESLLEVDGLPIYACEKGSPDRPTIFLSSGVHGDESSGPQALMALLTEGFFDERFHWLICPVMNPTGLVAGIRENADGIDLNRDYLNCQSKEVCAHIDWLKKQHVPQIFISLHEDWETTGFYYYEINQGADGPTHHEILKAASVSFPPEPERMIDDHEVTEPGWIYHSEHPDIPEGWPEAIYLAKMGCPLSLTFETPSSASLEKRIACHCAVAREAVKKLELQ